MPPALLVVQLLATVVVPVSLGMSVRHRWPAFAERHQPSLQRTGFALLAALLAMIIVADTPSFVAGLPGAVPLSAAFVAGSFVVGGGVGHALDADLRERIALAIEFATRNVAVATTLAVTLGRIEFATFATTYFLTELPVMVTAAVVFRAMSARKGERPCDEDGGPGRLARDGDHQPRPAPKRPSELRPSRPLEVLHASASHVTTKGPPRQPPS
jgi:BASS family bile acid:Na+ symporter